MELMNVDNFATIAAEANRRGIQKLGWFDFCSWVGDLWFKGKLSWDQKTTVNDWAWDVKNHPDAETVFGTIKYAYENGLVTY